MKRKLKTCIADVDRANNSIPPDNEAEESSEVEYGTTDVRVQSGGGAVREACDRKSSSVLPRGCQ
ncbi:hypothetical protein T12_996 [Trichinella patagoniensis]|uniref:Uncharacterized protein n=1 Tax=Trichinella patagoniensis TaxID=990121 RepID=A0A0V0ZNR1_9BILA|nr:hypothetical protein T12_4056 [Trichinella patagoniensis]KRY13790.1 hypothetical protein T12_996 [Trichinella patagoniensis]